MARTWLGHNAAPGDVEHELQFMVELKIGSDPEKKNAALA